MTATVSLQELAQRYALWPRIETAVTQQQVEQPVSFLQQVGRVPVQASRATRRLGCYVSIAGEPRCIRLQFSQESTALHQTLLHEVAHLCDHLENFNGQIYRGAHRRGWQSWALALGISTERCGTSVVVEQLYRQRLKPVAVCQGCGFVLYRQRRLARNRTYCHRECGHRLIPVSSVPIS